MKATAGRLVGVSWAGGGEPPAGLPVTVLQVFLRPGERHAPEVEAFIARTGVGSGWRLEGVAVTPPARRMTAEQRGKRRMGNLKKRVTQGRGAVGPMFAAEVIDAAMALKPAYFGGADMDPELAAYVQECDAQDAARWAAYVAFLSVTGKQIWMVE